VAARQPVWEVTLVTAPRRREGRAGQLYLERASLIEMTERPLLVMSRPLPGEQTQIVRRPVRRARGRRWLFVFGGAATATLLAAWLGFGHRARTAAPTTAALTAKAPAGLASAPETIAAARPIVAPLAAPPAFFAATVAGMAAPPLAPARRASRPAPASLASGRHTKVAPARIGSWSRLATRRAPAHGPRPAATVAWVDPFIDR